MKQELNHPKYKNNNNNCLHPYADPKTFLTWKIPLPLREIHFNSEDWLCSVLWYIGMLLSPLGGVSSFMPQNISSYKDPELYPSVKSYATIVDEFSKFRHCGWWSSVRIHESVSLSLDVDLIISGLSARIRVLYTQVGRSIFKSKRELTTTDQIHANFFFPPQLRN